MGDSVAWREALAVFATLLALTQVVPYVVSILRGRTRPSLTSYLIWAAVECLGAAAYVATLGPVAATWPRIAFAASGVTVLVLAIRRGRHTPVTKFEVASIVAAASGATAWLVFNTPMVSLLVSGAVSAIAYSTTIRKLWHHPGTEDVAAWVMTSAASVLNVVILTTVSADVLLPILVTLVGSAVITVLILRSAILNRRSERNEHHMNNTRVSA
ncbi:hypothetical protein ACPPVW_18625 [Leifsonia sp. McL0607]|uniref:hypothetical protein n=1 Tax=Leifsonia sp. McL0607 TaxID=3415672 RepID=UPI003CECE04E